MSHLIDPNETIATLVGAHPRAAQVLRRRGMYCASCAIAPFETLAEACDIYGVPLAELIDELERATSARRRAPDRRA